MDCVGNTCDEMWDEEDGFFYDVLRLPDGSATRLKVRSMVGLLPLAATTVISRGGRRALSRGHGAHPRVHRQAPQPDGQHRPARPAGRQRRRSCWRWSTRTSSAASSPACWTRSGSSARTASARCRAGTSITPTSWTWPARHFRVQYLPGESNSGMFGGNSNWRGPIWMPVNLLIVRALLQFYVYYGDDVQDRVPDRLGPADDAVRGGPGDLAAGWPAIFLRDDSGRRPVYGGVDQVPGGSALARPDLVPRVLPRRQRRRAGRQPPDRLDRGGGQADPAVRVPRPRRTSSAGAAPAPSCRTTER